MKQVCCSSRSSARNVVRLLQGQQKAVKTSWQDHPASCAACVGSWASNRSGSEQHDPTPVRVTSKPVQACTQQGQKSLKLLVM